MKKASGTASKPSLKGKSKDGGGTSSGSTLPGSGGPNGAIAEDVAPVALPTWKDWDEKDVGAKEFTGKHLYEEDDEGANLQLPRTLRNLVQGYKRPSEFIATVIAEAAAAVTLSPGPATAAASVAAPAAPTIGAPPPAQILVVHPSAGQYDLASLLRRQLTQRPTVASAGPVRDLSAPAASLAASATTVSPAAAVPPVPTSNGQESPGPNAEAVPAPTTWDDDEDIIQPAPRPTAAHQPLATQESSAAVLEAQVLPPTAAGQASAAPAADAKPAGDVKPPVDDLTIKEETAAEGASTPRGEALHLEATPTVAGESSHHAFPTTPAANAFTLQATMDGLVRANRHLLESDVMRRILASFQLMLEHAAQLKASASPNAAAAVSAAPIAGAAVPPTPSVTATAPNPVAAGVPTANPATVSGGEGAAAAATSQQATGSASGTAGGSTPAMVEDEKRDPLLDTAALPWDLIYPKSPKDGLPQHNPLGKYAVRLWWMGGWRRFSIDDRVPVDEAGRPLCLISPHGNEIWPILLSKALLKLATLSYDETEAGSEMGDFDPYFAMTGWVPELVEIRAEKRFRPALWSMLNDLAFRNQLAGVRGRSTSFHADHAELLADTLAETPGPGQAYPLTKDLNAPPVLIVANHEEEVGLLRTHSFSSLQRKQVSAGRAWF